METSDPEEDTTNGPDRDSDDCDSLEPAIRPEGHPVIEVSIHQPESPDREGPKNEWVEISVNPSTERISVVGAEEGETPVTVECGKSTSPCSSRGFTAVVTELDSLDSLDVDAADSLDGQSDSEVEEKLCVPGHHQQEHGAFPAITGAEQEKSALHEQATGGNNSNELQRRESDGGRTSDCTLSSRTLKPETGAFADLLRTLDVECDTLTESNTGDNVCTADGSSRLDTSKESSQGSPGCDVEEELCVAESKVVVESQYVHNPFTKSTFLVGRESLSEETVESLIVEEAPISKQEKITPSSLKLEESQPESCVSVQTGGQLESCPSSLPVGLPADPVDADMMDASLALGSEASNMQLPPPHYMKDPGGLSNHNSCVTANGNDGDNGSVHSDQSKGSLGERQRNTITEMYKESIERLRIDGEFKPIAGFTSGSRRSVNSSEMELNSYWNAGSHGNLNRAQDGLEASFKSSAYRGHGSADQLNQVGSQQTATNNASLSMERSRSIDRMLEFKKGTARSSSPKNENRYGQSDHKTSDYSGMNGSREHHAETSQYKSPTSTFSVTSILKNNTEEPQSTAINGGPFKFRNFHSGQNSRGGSTTPGSHADYSEPVSKHAYSSEYQELPGPGAPAIRTALITSRTAPLTHAATSSGSRAQGPLAPNSKEMYRIQDLEDSVTSLKRVLNDREREIDELKAHQRGLQAEMHQLRAVGATSEDKQKDPRLSTVIKERETLQAEVKQLQDALEQTRTGSGTVSGLKGHTTPLDDYSPNNPLVLQRKIGELECHLADVQEASDTAILKLEEAEKEISLLKEEQHLNSSSNSSASALQRENAKLREMLSAAGSGSVSVEPSYLMTEVSQLRHDLRALRDKNHQLTQDNIKLTEFIRDVENKPRDYARRDFDTKPRDNGAHDLDSKSRDIDSKTRENTSRFSTQVISPHVSRSRSYDFLKNETVEESHAARVSSGVSATRVSSGVSFGNQDNSFDNRHDRETSTRLRYDDGANRSTLQNGGARSGERYMERASRGRAEYMDVVMSQMSRHRGPERTTSAIRFSSEGNRAHSGPSHKSFLDDMADDPRYSSTLRSSTYTSPASRGASMNSLNLKTTATAKREEHADSQNFSDFRNWEQVEKYKTTKPGDLNMPDAHVAKERRKSGGSDSTSSLLNELTQQLGLQDSQEAAMVTPGLHSTPHTRYEPAPNTVSMPLSPPSSPDLVMEDTGSRWSKMGRSLEPKPLATQHNKHLLDDAICSHSSASNFNTNGKVPFAARSSSDVHVGDVVKFCRQGGKISRGVVKYIGHLPGKNDIYLGVELDHEIGKHDGTYEGQRYFSCPPNRGVFVAFSKVVMVWGMSQ